MVHCSGPNPSHKEIRQMAQAAADFITSQQTWNLIAPDRSGVSDGAGINDDPGPWGRGQDRGRRFPCGQDQTAARPRPSAICDELVNNQLNRERRRLHTSRTASSPGRFLRCLPGDGSPVGNHLFTLRLRLDGGFIAKAAQWPRLGLVTELTSFFSSGYVPRPCQAGPPARMGHRRGWGPATQ